MTDGIRFAMGGAIFGDLKLEHLDMIEHMGFPGIEPYRGWIMEWVDRPVELKDELDKRAITMVTCSNGGPNQSTDFINPDNRSKTIDDHLAFARDFLCVFGCEHFKINMGARPAGGTRQMDLRNIAETLNELGERLLGECNIKLAPHPHIWGPIERPEEVDQMLELTDPRYVWWIPDTAQLNLGGGDPLELMTRHYDRMAAVHWKDSAASYRGYTGPTPTRAQHEMSILYKDLGTGGVDLPGIWKLLLDRGWHGWITLDLDPPRRNEGEGTYEQKAEINRRYLLETLKVGRL